MTLQNSIFAPTPLAVTKGGTGNTTPTFSTGPLTVSTVGYRGPVGTAASPTYSFTGNINTGIYTTGGTVNITCQGINVASFDTDIPSSGHTNVFFINNTASSLYLKTNSSNDTGSIGYNTDSITFGIDGAITLTNALPIASGGTAATTQANAIKNIMPVATVNGTLAYYNGTNWVILAPPAAGTFFLKITSGGTGTGGTPFWSLV